VSSLLHTVYKCALFVLPVSTNQVNISLLFIWTFLGGLIFGWLKEYSRSAVPPAIAHAIFDIIAYAGYTHAPWWVW
jgi:membrane protease YdiL (CAAX protease family)